ncbi:hypothetical protein KKG90_09955 [Candidatus Bipolaricaulota bacterium]|nr:hypothetical protein [Candidatus Bipolaricaulota bacterium]
MTRRKLNQLGPKGLIAASLVILMGLPTASTADRRHVERALYEPEDGAIYHGTAPNPTIVDGYIAALADVTIAPLIEGIHLGAAGTLGRQSVVVTIRDWLSYVHAAGRIPHLSLSMTDENGDPSDVEIATTTKQDGVLEAIGAVIADYGEPLFIRLGFEFNGGWNGYTPGIYPIAYRKMVDLFTAAGVNQAAYIWCYEPDGPDDFDAVVDGQPAWYPGDDYVDWFGLDLFKAEHFTPPATDRERTNAAYVRSIRFLEMAENHGKPVMLSETAAANIHVTADEDDPDLVDGQSDWDAWFAPYFAFMVEYRQIKGFLYMNQDYRGTIYERDNGWGDARIEVNSHILEQYRNVLRQERFLHADDGLSNP